MSRSSALSARNHTTTTSITSHMTAGRTGYRIQDASGRYRYDGPSPKRRDSRRRKCEHEDDPELGKIGVEYVILFPFESDPAVARLSFEIDQKAQKFRTIGLDVKSTKPQEQKVSRKQRHFLEEDSDDGDYDIIPKRNLDGEKEQVPQRSSVWLRSCAANGDVQSLQECLDGSSHPDRLVLCTNDKGESLLLLAVQNGHLDMVNCLIEHKCYVNTMDRRDRTPLMEAALWGHPRIVHALLEAGASRSSTDESGMTAYQLALESDRNDEERHKRNPDYREDPYVKKRHRLFIRGLLRENDQHPSPTYDLNKPENLRDAHFYKSILAETISFVVPSFGVWVPTHIETRTAAILLREDPFPPVITISGTNGSPADDFRDSKWGFERLEKMYWSKETKKVAEDLGIPFQQPEKYEICHAEVQLMSFFIRRNFLFLNYRGPDILIEDKIEDDFLQLFMLQPGRNCTATILVSRKPCDSCREFKDQIKERIGIDFTIVTYPMRRD